MEPLFNSATCWPSNSCHLLWLWIALRSLDWHLHGKKRHHHHLLLSKVPELSSGRHIRCYKVCSRVLICLCNMSLLETHSSFAKSISSFDWPTTCQLKKLIRTQSEVFFVDAQRPRDIPEKIRLFFFGLWILANWSPSQQCQSVMVRPVCCYWLATARLFSHSFTIRQVAVIGRCLMSLEPSQNSRSALPSVCLCPPRSLVGLQLAQSAVSSSPRPAPPETGLNIQSRASEGLRPPPEPLSCQRCWMLEHFIWMSNEEECWDTGYLLAPSWDFSISMQKPFDLDFCPCFDGRIRYHAELFLN